MANMTLITSVTVGAGGTSYVTLPASGTIPDTYADLKIIASARSTRSDNNDPLIIEFNGSTTGYSMKALRGTGAAAQSISDTSIWVGAIPGSTATSDTFGSVEVYIPDYQSASPKSVSSDGVGENDATTAYSLLSAGLWDIATDVAITTIKLYAQNGNLVEGSTFYLYGVSSTSYSPSALGGVVSQDNDYWYHTFPFSSTFTPTSALSADILCIAGGGSGGWQGGAGGAGGGGAGGLLTFTSQSLTTTGYTVTVGAGATNIANEAGTTGSDSQFGSLTLVKGGGGGGRDSSTVGNERYMGGKTGGSGGGGGINADNSTTPPAGSATSGQGNNGGSGFGGYGSGGGGGGAGSVGANTVSQKVAGAGGAGVNTYASWANATFTGINGYYAGGGGGGAGPSTTTTGGAGGLGGGGLGGGDNQSSSAGVRNTGGGGGAGGYPNGGNGQNGGSGLVIVRYAK
jgi:hypothetical protein